MSLPLILLFSPMAGHCGRVVQVSVVFVVARTFYLRCY